MMKTLIATIALGAALIPAAASAQAKTNDIAVGGFPIQNLTRQQAQQMADGIFERLDADHNGTVTRQEAEQVREQMGMGGERAQRMIERTFGVSQSLTLKQFEDQQLARFDRQDLNHDGVVTAEERQQARALRQAAKTDDAQ
jgi:Ca2+-binding EF-hand superfamily protein